MLSIFLRLRGRIRSGNGIYSRSHSRMRKEGGRVVELK